MPIKSYLETAALRGQCAYENGIRDDECPYSQKQYVMAWLRGWGLASLEDQVRDAHIGFKGHRICHHASDATCCRGFWEAHKDEFPAGQIAQRLGLVEFVDRDDR